MNDEIDERDPLMPMVRRWQQGVPIAPGLERRARRRQAIRRRTRLVGAAGVAATVAIVAVLLARTPGTPVTFALTAPTVRSVSVVGDFNDWRSDGTRLARNADGEWEGTLRLRPGRYRYAYLVNHQQWRADTREPSAPDDFGRPTSVLTIAGR